MAEQFFTEDTLAFLTELALHNRREWFNDNKQSYENYVRNPALEFIDAMEGRMEKISPCFPAIPKKSGGSLMRIYRDVRFSRDKSPYKTNIGIQFRHKAGKDVHAPGYYLHIEPTQVFVAAGMWHPPGSALAAIRQAIDEHPDAWRKAVGNAAFKRNFQLAGDSLKRPPRGFSTDHALIEDLKRKDFIAVRDLELKTVLKKDFPDKVAGFFDKGTPFMKFLCKAIGVPF